MDMEISFHPAIRSDNTYMGGKREFLAVINLSAQRVYVPPQPGYMLQPAAAWCIAEDREADLAEVSKNPIRVLFKICNVSI